eukprot:CAMPEP_0169150452 /NCGR_PEP_ID=MMETSP1015-20121227/50200_1 /TAXON_ID=342587 /ORGANISM="Karlodinium micrum, Strain CCMP2283" /LENGTH=1069 /DNA_ID=CAMNT_0009219605 /DNA_START=14 /DNA_END=3223 /DNA_ORIENTATION=+
MELKLVSSRGVPDGSIVSIKVGTVRRQAPVGSDRPYRFSGLKNGKQQMKVDVFAPVAQARLLIEPCEAHCSVHLNDGPSHLLDKGKLLDDEDMFLDFAVSGCLSEGGNSENEANYVQLSRPSSAQSGKNAARRHQVALEAQPYFEQHSLMETMQTMLQGVLKEKPADPYAYMMRILENSRNAAAGAAQHKQRQRPASALARTGPAPKKLQSALRPSSSRTPGSRSRGETKVSWSTLPVIPLSPGNLSVPVSPSLRRNFAGNDLNTIARIEEQQIEMTTSPKHRNSSPAVLESVDFSSSAEPLLRSIADEKATHLEDDNVMDLKPLIDDYEEVDFDMQQLSRIKLLASDLDKTLYPHGMGDGTTDPTPEARHEFDKNIAGFMAFMKSGGLAIPVTGNSPAFAQKKFDRSTITWNVEGNGGVFCNGALVLGIGGVIEYSAPVPTMMLKQLQAWAAESDGFFQFEGKRYPFAVNCVTKSKLLYLPPKHESRESRKVADSWASLQLMENEIVEPGFDWDMFPAYQVNLLLQSRSDLLKEYPASEEDVDSRITIMQIALLDLLERRIGRLDSVGCQGAHVIEPWCETTISICGVSKGQSLNRFIHSKSVQQVLGVVDVGREVMVAGDAANDLPMFIEWPQVDDFNGETLSKTGRPAVRVIMPDGDDMKLSRESTLRNKVHEVLAAIAKMQVSAHGSPPPPIEQHQVGQVDAVTDEPVSQRRSTNPTLPTNGSISPSRVVSADSGDVHAHMVSPLRQDIMQDDDRVGIHSRHNCPEFPKDGASIAKASLDSMGNVELASSVDGRCLDNSSFENSLPTHGCDVVPEESPLAASLTSRADVSTTGDLRMLLRHGIAKAAEQNMLQDLLMRSWEAGERVIASSLPSGERCLGFNEDNVTAYRSHEVPAFQHEESLKHIDAACGHIDAARDNWMMSNAPFQRINCPDLSHQILGAEIDQRISSPVRVHRYSDTDIAQRISSPARAQRMADAETGRPSSSPSMKYIAVDATSHTIHAASPWGYSPSIASESDRRDDTGWVPEVESLREETVALRQRTEHLESLMRKFMNIHDVDSLHDRH